MAHDAKHRGDNLTGEAGLVVGHTVLLANRLDFDGDLWISTGRNAWEQVVLDLMAQMT